MIYKLVDNSEALVNTQLSIIMNCYLRSNLMKGKLDSSAKVFAMFSWSMILLHIASLPLIMNSSSGYWNSSVVAILLINIAVWHLRAASTFPAWFTVNS